MSVANKECGHLHVPKLDACLVPDWVEDICSWKTDLKQIDVCYLDSLLDPTLLFDVRWTMWLSFQCCLKHSLYLPIFSMSTLVSS